MGGNSPSRVENERGRVHLTLERDKVYPGEKKFRGVASLTVKKPVDCAGVYASLSGEIKTEFQGKAPSNDNRTYRSTEAAMATLTRRLGPSSGKKQDSGKLHLEPGAYEYPFEMAVPARLQPSCRIGASSISYTLVVSFPQNAPPKKSKRDVYVDHEVSVLAKRLTADPSRVLERSTTGSMCCCPMAGELWWNIELDKTQVQLQGDYVSAAVRVQNNTTRPLAGFTVELRMRTVVKAENEKQEKTVKGSRRTVAAVVEPGEGYAETVRLPFRALSLQDTLPLASCDTNLIKVVYEVVVCPFSSSWVAIWDPIVMNLHAYGDLQGGSAATSSSLDTAFEVAEEVALAVPKLDAEAAYDYDECDDDDDQPQVLKATIVDPNSPL